MKYVDGYINLDKEKIIKDPNPKTTKYGMNKSFWFLINNQEYFYKNCLELDEAYMELFSSIIARYVNIKTVNYDLAKFRNLIGVVSLNYNEKHCYERTILEIGKKYYNEKISKNNQYNLSLSDMYNLEMIWDALKYYYQNELVVLNIMKSIIDSFILQILTGNCDLNVSNLVIIEDEIPVLAPNHDYSLQISIGNMPLDYALDVEPKSNKDAIDNFLLSSSDEFIYYFKEKVLMLPKIENIFLRVELKTHKKIPQNIKDKYQEWYLNNQQMLLEKINLRLQEPKIS